MKYSKLSYFLCLGFWLLNGQVLKAQNEKSISQFYLSNTEEWVTFSDPGDWEYCRWKIERGMESVMGSLPDRNSLPGVEMKIIQSVDSPMYVMHTIEYQAFEDEWVPAYLYLPKRKPVSGRLPAMLALHPTGAKGKAIVDGQGPNPNRAYGKELAERGYIVIAPDYPSFGGLSDFDFDHDRYESGTMAAIFYNLRSVDLLLQMEEVDSDRIGVIGHSLAGHNAIFTAACDERLKVIVSSCGWTQLDYYDIGEAAHELYGGRLGPFAQKRYMPLWKNFGFEGEKKPFDYHELIAMLAPRHFLSVSPVNDSNFDVRGVLLGMEQASTVYQFLGVEDHLQSVYPEAEHDFPVEARKKSYEFIDQALSHVPWKHRIE